MMKAETISSDSDRDLELLIKSLSLIQDYLLEIVADRKKRLEAQKINERFYKGESNRFLPYVPKFPKPL